VNEGSPVRAAVVLLAAGLLFGCHFDSSGSVAGAGDGGPPGGDDGGGPDAGPCAEPIHAELTVNGVSGAAEPFVTVLIGDSVRLSASGSCTRSGTIAYDWAITGDGDGTAIEGTAAPDLASEVVDIYPVAPGDYTVTLAVGDGASSADPLTVLAFRAVGWQVSGESLDIRKVDTTPGALWIADTAGAHQLPLANVLGVPVLVNGLAGGDDTIPNDLSAVAAGLGGTVWFGHKPNDSTVWRVDVDNGRATAIDFSAAMGGESMVEDIGRGDTGIVIATRDGVSAAPDNQTFEAPLITAQSFALARGGSGGWAGGAMLYRLPAGTEFDLFGTSDNKIRALLEVDGEIWAGSDDQGVALFDSGTLTVTDTFVVADGLPSARVRAIAVDTTGDVWVATDKGVGRYKRDRAVWVAMKAASGLAGATDVGALTTAGIGDARKIIAGTKQGVALLTLP
jgi:hypothetical protein